MLLLARPCRQLASASSSDTSASYTYDISGIRNGKAVDGTVYKYNTLSGHVMRQEWDGKSIDFIYDDANQPYAMRYRSSAYAAPETYYYILNVQGDVVGLMDSNGVKAVSYSYDPWGKPLDTTILTAGSSSECLAWETAAEVNPLRYRGYYYDTETGFYCLLSRYYDPVIGRFINADTFATTDITGLLSSNMFAYCENNPVMNCDPTGELFFGTFSGLIIGGIAGGLNAHYSNGDIIAGIATGALNGAACGFVSDVVIDLNISTAGIPLLVCGISGFFTDLANQAFNGKNCRTYDWGSAFISGAFSALSFGLCNSLNSLISGLPQAAKDFLLTIRNVGTALTGTCLSAAYSDHHQKKQKEQYVQYVQEMMPQWINITEHYRAQVVK